MRWSFIVFPVWVFMISICILWDNFQRPPSDNAGRG
jgi:hypothetical protein